MTGNLTITLDLGHKLTDFFEGMTRRLARAELSPILKQHFAPVVAAEKGFIHSESGALAASLKPRMGGGDRPDTMSVFSAPTATRKQLIKHWSRGRSQQRRWAANIEPGRGRRSVFYGVFVERGHRTVKRNAAGQLYDTGKRVPAHPFAAPAMEAIGDQQSEAMEADVLSWIVDGTRAK